MNVHSIRTQRAATNGDLWARAVGACLESGWFFDSREGVCQEIIGYMDSVPSLEAIVATPRVGFSPTYLGAELLWYLSGTNDATMIRHYAPQYTRWIEEDGTMFGALGPRLMRQLPNALGVLRSSPETRRCVLPIFDSEDLFLSNSSIKNVPCYTAFQFLIRGKRLYMVAHMRSNDAWIGLAYDCPAFMTIGCMIANALGLKGGFYVHQVSSLHLYARNQEAAKRLFSDQGEFQCPPTCAKALVPIRRGTWIRRDCNELDPTVIDEALLIESAARAAHPGRLDMLTALKRREEWTNGSKLGPLFDIVALAVCGCLIIDGEWKSAATAARYVRNMSLRLSALAEINRKEKSDESADNI